MKEKTIYTCQQCGQGYSKWLGRCQECGAWNSVVEERAEAIVQITAKSSGQKPQAIEEISLEKLPRTRSEISELDNVLGGGLVPGSVVLVGGEPGIGKSTLLLQASAAFAGLPDHSVLYASGEESASQIALRAGRLNVKSKTLYVAAETCLEQILKSIEELAPRIVIVDSIQTMQSDGLDSQPGSVGQIRECAYRLISLAKTKNISVFLVGHITKEGSIAGPKLLEHMVDVVLLFESMSAHGFRILRAMKNRFGSTNEIGLFEMSSSGIKEVQNPSEFFLAERNTQTPGTSIVASLEGNRPLLVEVQSLVSQSPLAIPRRTAIGLDHNRIALLVAILEKRAGYRLFDQDIYVNVAGGLKLAETALDLGVCAAVLSSFTAKALEKNSVFIGEVGLGGEIRSVARTDSRLREAARIGFKRAYVPSRTKEELKGDVGLELVGLKHIGALSDYM